MVEGFVGIGVYKDPRTHRRLGARPGVPDFPHLNPKPLNPKPSNPQTLKLQTLNLKPLNPKPLNPEPRDPKHLNP